PQDVLNRIASTASPRSSIIVSDEPLSKETNYRTEFVAVLSNQPQGGFITRARTPATDFMTDDPMWGGWAAAGVPFFRAASSHNAAWTRGRARCNAPSTRGPANRAARSANPNR